MEANLFLFSVLLVRFGNSYNNTTVLEGNGTSEMGGTNQTNQTRPLPSYGFDEASKYTLHSHNRNYYDKFARCAEEMQSFQCTIDCVYRRHRITRHNHINRRYLRRYLKFNHLYNNDTHMEYARNMCKNNYKRCIQTAAGIDFREECSMVVDFDYCFNDPRTTVERNREWVFFEGLPSNLHKNTTDYERVVYDINLCRKTVWYTYKAVLYDPRHVDMCTMACVFKRHMVFWKNKVNKDMFESFRNKIYTKEYLAHIDQFYSLERCIDMARMYYDECWSALSLDICSERFIPYYN